MKKCIGFVRVRDGMSAWVRCENRAETSDRLCADHREALDSAMLGILDAESRMAALKKSAEQLFTCAGHAKRCGGKSRRPSGSNRTRQARVPQTL
jgi:hypothetical protein